MERTFLMLKPDAVQRNIIGRAIDRIESTGLKLVAMKFIKMDMELAEKHYGIHKGKPFYEELVNFITSGPVVPMVWEGKNAVEYGRKLMGKTDPQDSAPGSIRGDFGIDIGRNIIHGSDSPENAVKEISIFFSESELVEWDSNRNKWLYP